LGNANVVADTSAIGVMEKIAGQWQPFFPQSPPQFFSSLQGLELSDPLRQQVLFACSFCSSLLQQLLLPPQARAVLVGAATKASINATVSNMGVKNFIIPITSGGLILFCQRMHCC
jgi:hypothetical protein